MDTNRKSLQEAKFPIPIVRTKLHRPAIPAGLITRVHKMDRWALDESLALILLSAPAGYGKTTLVSQWLANYGGRSVWLSLDVADNDLVRFVVYLVAALRTEFSDICSEVLTLLDRRDPQELAGIFCNELDDIDEPFVVVLDDYSRIRKPEIHEFMKWVLEHPSEHLQLIVITRRDPPFALASMRARGVLREVRMRDLEFSPEESKDLLQRETAGKIGEEILAKVSQRIEGWPVGLRLASLALSQSTEPGTLVEGFSGNLRDVSDYLGSELMSNLQPLVRERLLKISILNRFCGELCEQVWLGEEAADGDASKAGSFIDKLQRSGMFCVSLDAQQKWFRFHHLFQEMLQQGLSKLCSASEISELNMRASAWCERAGLLEEAFQYSGEGQGVAATAALMARHHIELMNTERWGWVRDLLDTVPSTVIDETPGLLVIKAYLQYQAGEHESCIESLDNLETQLPKRKPLTDELRSIRGTIDLLRGGLLAYQGRAKESDVILKRALRALPVEAHVMRGLAVVVRVVVLCLCGKNKDAQKVVSTALAVRAGDGLNDKFRVRALIALAFLQWWRAEYFELKMSGAAIGELSSQSYTTESMTFGRYMEAIASYDHNNLVEVITLVSPIVYDPRINNIRYYPQCGFLLANAQHGLGMTDEARATAMLVVERLQQTGRERFLIEARAFQADLALRQGRSAQAAKWADDYEPQIYITIEYFVAYLTFIKQRIALGTAEALQQAGRHIAEYEKHVRDNNNLPCLINVLAVKALLLEALGDINAAEDALNESVAYALPGGILRPFIDLGHPMAVLLHRLKAEEETLVFIGQILSVIRGAARPANTTIDAAGQSELDPLTKRELEILGLLVDRLTNREIAERLFISVGTVKRHTANIYQKLGTEGRRQTVIKAKSTGLIRNTSTTP